LFDKESFSMMEIRPRLTDASTGPTTTIEQMRELRVEAPPGFRNHGIVIAR
jgi:hypothetical protein